MRGRCAFGVLACVAVATWGLAKPRPLALRRIDVPLPGAPSTVLTTDVDADGRMDLLVVTAYTQWGSISEDRIEDAVAVTEVVPALFDRREILPFLAQADGRYRAAEAFPMPPTWIALAAGTREYPALALTEGGIEGVSWSREGRLVAAPLLSEPSAFAGARVFLADFAFLHDVDADGRRDAVIPSAGGVAIHRGTADGGFDAEAIFRARLPGDRVTAIGGHARRNVPTTSFFDVDGDAKDDLVVNELEASPQRIVVAKGLGGGRFGEAQAVRLGCLSKDAPDDGAGESRRVAWFGGLAPKSAPLLLTRETIDTGKSERKQAMAPRMRYGTHRLGPDLTVAPAPATSFDAEGYAFSGAFQDGVDLEFIDLDGDGRKDLVTVTVDVSVFQVLRALTSKKIGIGLEFRVFPQGADGSFRAVPGQVLHEKLNIDLNRFEISRLGQFQGDFDGDGRVDFVHLGKGKSVTIHRGQPGGRYPERPDLVVAMEEEPEDVLLVRVRDLDGDGRSDIAVTRTLPPPEAGASSLARLELYLSGTPR